jgi:hypothetical protein
LKVFFQYQNIIDPKQSFKNQTDLIGAGAYIGIVKEEFKPILNWENENATWMMYQEALKQSNLHYGLKNLLEVIEDYYPKITTLS